MDKIGFILEGVMKCANYTNASHEINPHLIRKSLSLGKKINNNV